MVSPAHLWSDLSRLSLWASLGLGVMLAGSWRARSLSLTEAVVLVCFVLFVVSTVRTGRALRIPWAAVGLLTLAAVTALQALPLGPVVGGLSPHAVETLGALGHSAQTISYEVSATWREVLKYTLYAALVIAAYGLARRRSLRLVLIAVPLAALASVAVALLHRAFGLETLFGIIPRRSAQAMGLTTLPNANHAAGLTALGALTALGLALEWSGSRARLALFALSGTLALISVLQVSLGGLAGLLIGLMVFGALAYRRKAVERLSWDWAPVLLLPVAGALFASTRLVEGLSPEASRASLEAKLEGIVNSGPMILDHWRFGVGRGAFGSVFTRYRGSDQQLSFVFPENIVAQLTSEWGLVLGSLALLGLLAAVLVRLVKAERIGSIGALAGVAAVLAQNLVDFSLEVPGVAMAVAVVIGATTPHARRRSRLRIAGVRRVITALALCAVAGLATWMMFRSGDLDLDLERLQTAVHRVQKGQDIDLSQVRRVAARHPASAAVQVQAAYALTFAPEPDRRAGLTAINHALLLAPRDAEAAILAGRILGAAGYRRQGLEEMRRAWRLTGGTTTTLRAAAELARSAPAFLNAVPRRDVALDLLDEVALARAIRVLRRAYPEWSGVLMAALPPVDQIPEAALSEVGAAALVAGDLALARVIVQAEIERHPDQPKALVMLARLSYRTQRWDEAWAALSALPEPIQAEAANLELRFRVAAAREDWAQADDTLQWMKRVLPMRREREAQLERMRSELELAQGRKDRAVAALDKALLWTPSDLELRLVRSRLLVQLGRRVDAASDLRFVLRRAPEHKAARAALKRLEDAQSLDSSRRAAPIRP